MAEVQRKLTTKFSEVHC